MSAPQLDVDRFRRAQATPDREIGSSRRLTPECRLNAQEDGDPALTNANNQLRDEHGGLLGGLQVEDYNQGIADFEAGAPPLAITSASYDLGRQRAADKAARDAAFWASYEQRHREQMERIRLVIPAEAFAELEARHRATDARYAREES